MDELILVLDGNDDLELVISDEASIELEIGEGASAPAYPGPYTVTPILYDEQILEVNGMLMTDNVTVKEIPVVYTSNPYDGKTVVIG